MNAREAVVMRRIESRMVIDRRCFMVGLLGLNEKGVDIGIFSTDINQIRYISHYR